MGEPVVRGVTKREHKQLVDMVERAAVERAELREAIMSLTKSMSTLRAEVMDGIGERLSEVEHRLGDIANKLQAHESFFNTAKTWSLKVVFTVLFGLAFGSTVLGKVLDFIIKAGGFK